jgi:Arc/MetJ-type ribon-helix-helix transcriptional regulator
MFDIPYIYFGESLNHRYYKYAIYNTEHFGNEVRISRINIDNSNVEPVNIDIYQNNSHYLREKLHKLYNELKKNPKDYKRIQKFIKENENKGNEKRKNAIKKLRKYYKHIHLNNTKCITDNLVRSLRKEGVDLSRNILIKLINQEQEFIQTQIQKSINKHMQSNRIKISNVYNNIPENEETYYERFFQEGKRRANLLKTEEPKINKRNENYAQYMRNRNPNEI